MPYDLALDVPALDETLDAEAGIHRSLLDGGVRLLTQTDRSVRSASIGFWLPVGSRDEAPRHAGSTHVLEHLLFKGTERRTAMEIASAFDEVGGESNAVTAKEHTFYYGRVRSADVPMALDVLTDMITSSHLANEALDTEREVILEELAMAADDPGDIGYETFLEQVIGAGTALGRPVGGTPESVRALTGADVRSHYAEHYRPDNLVVTAVGDVDRAQLEQQLLERLRAGGWDLPQGARPSARRPEAMDRPTGGTADVSSLVPHRLERDTEQVHVYLGGPGIPATDPDRHTMNVLMAILGGGMSSRLFQHIREERGLAYSVYSFSGGYREAGLFGMYAACRPSRTQEVVRLLGEEMAELGRTGPTDEEMRRALGQITGSLALGLEDTTSRMGRLGSIELIHGRYASVDETIGRIAAVTAHDIQELAATLARSFTTRVEIGPSL